MKLTVYKGFDIHFLERVDGTPLIEDVVSKKRMS